MTKEQLPLDKAKPIYFISADGNVQEGHIIFKNSEKSAADKAKDALYIVFLSVGIISFVSAIISYKNQ